MGKSIRGSCKYTTSPAACAEALLSVIVCNSNAKYASRFNENKQLVLQFSPATQRTAHVVILRLNFCNQATTRGVRGAICFSICAVRVRQLPAGSCSNMGADRFSWHQNRKSEEKEREEAELRHVIMFPVKASPSGYG